MFPLFPSDSGMSIDAKRCTIKSVIIVSNDTMRCSASIRASLSSARRASISFRSVLSPSMIEVSKAFRSAISFSNFASKSCTAVVSDSTSSLSLSFACSSRSSRRSCKACKAVSVVVVVVVVEVTLKSMEPVIATSPSVARDPFSARTLPPTCRTRP